LLGSRACAARGLLFSRLLTLTVPISGAPACITDDPTPEVAATGHQRTIITIQEQYLSEWLSPSGLSKERLDQILSDKELPYYIHQIAA
jgi:hypothetical protein